LGLSNDVDAFGGGFRLWLRRLRGSFFLEEMEDRDGAMEVAVSGGEVAAAEVDGVAVAICCLKAMAA
jgi:hypothetical protein